MHAKIIGGGNPSTPWPACDSIYFKVMQYLYAKICSVISRNLHSANTNQFQLRDIIKEYSHIGTVKKQTTAMLAAT